MFSLAAYANAPLSSLLDTHCRKNKLEHKKMSLQTLGYAGGNTGIKLFLIQCLRLRFSAAAVV